MKELHLFTHKEIFEIQEYFEKTGLLPNGMNKTFYDELITKVHGKNPLISEKLLNLLNDLQWMIQPYIEQYTPEDLYDESPPIFNLCCQYFIYSQGYKIEEHEDIRGLFVLPYCGRCFEIGRQ